MDQIGLKFFAALVNFSKLCTMSIFSVKYALLALEFHQEVRRNAESGDCRIMKARNLKNFYLHFLESEMNSKPKVCALCYIFNC